MGEVVPLRYCYHGKETHRPAETWGPGYKEQCKIMLVHQGKGIYETNGHRHELEKGQGFIVFPDSVCFKQADEQDPWVYSWIAFDGEGVHRILQQIHVSPEQPMFSFPHIDWFDDYLQRFSLADRERNCGLRKQGILHQFLAEWIDLVTSSLPTQGIARAKDVYVQKTLEHLHMNYSEKISIIEIADQIGIDRIYLSTLFKESQGVSPQQYLLQYRMDKAVQLMGNMELTIADVSRSVGYQDPFLFSKMFKKQKGVSPSQYRAKGV